MRYGLLFMMIMIEVNMTDSTNRGAKEAPLDIPSVSLDIQMGKGAGDRAAWIAGNIPLQNGHPQNIKFRATEADKEIIAKTIIGIMKRWAKIDD